MLQRDNRLYFLKNISNKVLFHLLKDDRTKYSLKEYGTIINDKNIKFIVNIDITSKVVKEIINQAIGDEKLGFYTFMLVIKYKNSFKFNIRDRKFSDYEIKTSNSYYFSPVKTTSRYLFKHYRLDEYFVDSLKNNYIWFSDPKNFNDTFDCRTIFDSEVSEENIKRFYYRKYNEADAGILSLEEFLKSFKVPPKEQFNMDLEKYHFENTFSSLGIACFTEKHDNKLMWSHYSDGYKGICLIFDFNILKEKNKEYYTFNGSKVKYTSNLPKLYFDATGEMDITTLVFTKLKEYNYENEIREVESYQFKPLNRKVKFNPKALKEIIFGAKCKQSDKNKVLKLIADCNQYSNIKFIDTEIDIAFNKINLLNNDLDIEI